MEAQPPGPTKSEAIRAYMMRVLNRPIRVCSMVKNLGEPGGGPFWVRDGDGALSLQVVETPQIDSTSPRQREIAESSTHFNPTDMVCGLRHSEGGNFRLRDFVDPDTGFVTVKSKDGKTLKALEWPGLWNGSMAFWNSVFIEMPAWTFNPVKSVNDLLRPSHRQS